MFVSCDPTDCSPPRSSIHGILQARILEWVAISFSMNKIICVYIYMCQLLSRIRFFESPWTIAYQASLSMEFSRQEYWSGLPSPSPCMYTYMCTYVCIYMQLAKSQAHSSFSNVKLPFTFSRHAGTRQF